MVIPGTSSFDSSTPSSLPLIPRSRSSLGLLTPEGSKEPLSGRFEHCDSAAELISHPVSLSRASSEPGFPTAVADQLELTICVESDEQSTDRHLLDHPPQVQTDEPVARPYLATDVDTRRGGPIVRTLTGDLSLQEALELTEHRVIPSAKVWDPIRAAEIDKLHPARG